MKYEVNVTDAMGRPRRLAVEVTPGRVGVSVPPGEGFGLSADQADILSGVLRMAARDARG